MDSGVQGLIHEWLEKMSRTACPSGLLAGVEVFAAIAEDEQVEIRIHCKTWRGESIRCRERKDKEKRDKGGQRIHGETERETRANAVNVAVLAWSGSLAGRIRTGDTNRCACHFQILPVGVAGSW